MSERDDINRKAEAARAAYLERSSIAFLECAISLMLSHMDKERVIEILKEEARMIEEFD